MNQRLDVQSLGLGDERRVRIATIIAEETEAQRELERIKFPDPEPPKPGENSLAELLRGSYNYANSLRWDQLLTSTECVERVIRRTDLTASAVIEFAMDHCRPSDWRMLFWFFTAMKIIDENATLRSLSAAAKASQLKAFSEQQSARARRRHELDPKQVAKAQVKDWWRKWRLDRSLYPSAAEFARAMQDKYPDQLKSEAVIQQWVRQWRLEDGQT